MAYRILSGGNKCRQVSGIKVAKEFTSYRKGRSPTKKAMPAGAALSPYDTAEFLRTPEEIATYLEVVCEDHGDDPAMIAKALGNAARDQGMQKIAKATGLSREGLYQALSGKSNPSFDTILKVMNAVGIEFRPKAMAKRRRKAA